MQAGPALLLRTSVRAKPRRRPRPQHLLERVDEAAADGREEFRPLIELTPEERRQVITLPPSIARLTAVKHLVLYGSNLVRIPPEIGAMTSLEEFTPYASYRLHWFPYEITRCRKLTCSTVSTRALFGNYKLRPPFPRLQPPPDSVADLDLEKSGSTALGSHSHSQLQRLRPPARTGRTPTDVDLTTRGHRRSAPAGQRLLIGVCGRAARQRS